ncbi:hypothetical protein KL939_001037 [Ogataea angusta]|nr:hypothetical protein KL939_001037 [Ogataea angusta]
MSAIEQILQHLDTAESEPVDHKLFEQAKLKLKDASYYESTEILRAFGSQVIRIVSSNNTSADWKNHAIDLFNEVINHYHFDTIVQEFSLEMLISGLQGHNENLKILIIDIVARATPPDLVANTPFISIMLNLLADPATTIGTVGAIERSLVVLAKGELVQRRLLSKECLDLLRKIRADSQVFSRCFDLCSELLPVMKDLPDDLYLMPESEFSQSNDVLLNAYVVSFYNKLLDTIRFDKIDLLDKLDEQIGYICRLYVDDTFVPEIKTLFSLEPVVFLANLSRLDASKFAEFDRQYKIIDHATSHSDEPSVFLLSNIDPRLLASKTQFLETLPLTATTVQIFENLVSKQEIFSKLDIPPSKILNLSTSSFLELVRALSLYDHTVAQLIRWPSVMNRLLDEYKNINNPEIWKLKMAILEQLYNRNVDVWKEKIEQELARMKGHTEAQVDIMDMAA